MARACLDYVAGLAVQAAPSAEAARQRALDEAMISPAQAARELEISRNRPRAWLRAGHVEGWDAASQTAPRAAWRKAASRKPGRPVGAR